MIDEVTIQVKDPTEKVRKPIIRKPPEGPVVPLSCTMLTTELLDESDAEYIEELKEIEKKCLEESQDILKSMIEEVNIKVRDPTEPAKQPLIIRKPSEKYWPLTRSTLTKELQEHAAKYINETEEIKSKSIEEAMQYIRNVLKIEFPLDEAYILCFLRHSKYDVKKSIKIMTEGFKFIYKHQWLFDRNDPEVVRRVIDSKILSFLPYRDAKRRAILLCRAEWWNPHDISIEDLIYGTIVSFHVAGKNEVNQVSGYVIICDFKGATFNQMMAIGRWMIFGLKALQKLCPVLIKEIHVVHTPEVIRAGWKIVRMLLSEKIRSRVIFYKSEHWESLHKRVPPEILPAELGGYLGPHSTEHWAVEFDRIWEHYKEKLQLLLKIGSVV